jgi:hypothetical protein
MAYFGGGVQRSRARQNGMCRLPGARSNQLNRQHTLPAVPIPSSQRGVSTVQANAAHAAAAAAAAAVAVAAAAAVFVCAVQYKQLLQQRTRPEASVRTCCACW